MSETSAGIIIYHRTKEGPKFLLLYHGGRYWNFPKGKIGTRITRLHSSDPSKTSVKPSQMPLQGSRRITKESSFQAALREVREETGLSKRDLRFSNWFKSYDRFTFSRQGKKVFKTVTYYLAETSKKEIRLSDEHSGYGWFLYRDALKMLIYPNLKNTLKRAYDTIRGKRLSRGKQNPARPAHHL